MSLRALAFIVALLTALVQSGAVLAHASLVRAEPADGGLVAEPPSELRLMFNEPVTPLVMRLIAPDGTATTPAATAENTTVTITPPVPLRRGTHVLSWRVISADGHPVGGSLVFSVGEASAQPAQGALPAGDPIVRAAFWAAKIVIYLAIVVGIGGVRADVVVGAPRRPDRILVSLLVAGLVDAVVGWPQGLDALDLRCRHWRKVGLKPALRRHAE
jgi:copper transport protein